MKYALLALVIILLLVLIGPFTAAIDPMLTDPGHQLQPPNILHPLGTDFLGRDVFSRFLYGGQRTVLIAFLATTLAALPGLTLGLVAGVLPNWTDRLITSLLNVMLAIPGLLIALVILTLLGKGALPISLATGIMQLAPYARMTRASVRSVRSLSYMEAAYAMGASRFQIVLYHILPNIQPTLLAYTGVVFGYCLLNSAALSFLGLAGEFGIPDWGVMLAEGRNVFRDAPWVWLPPGLAISITVLTLNFLADQITRLSARHG